MAFPALVADFDLTVGQLQWVVICFVLVSGGMLVPAGFVGDRIGHDRMALLGAGCSVVALSACALAPGFGWFLAGRTLQGLGTAMVMASAPALAAAAVGSGAANAAGRFQTAAAIGLATGPILGALMVITIGWRGVFWFRLPLAVGLAVLAVANRPRRSSGSRVPSPTVAGRDWVGASMIAVIVAVTLGAFGLRTLGWGRAALLLLVAVALVVVFVRRALGHPAPVLNPRLFAHRDFTAAMTATMVINGAVFATWLLVPALLIDRLELPVLSAGAILALSPTATAVAASRSHLLSRVIGVRASTIVGLALLAIGMATVAQAGEDRSLLIVIVGLVITGAGLGLFSVPNMAVVMVALPASEQGVAGALSLMMRTLGIVAGVALQGDLFDRVDAVDGFAVAYRQVFFASFAILVVALVMTLTTALVDRGRLSPA